MGRFLVVLYGTLFAVGLVCALLNAPAALTMAVSFIVGVVVAAMMLP